jgi:hypothetical protein
VLPGSAGPGAIVCADSDVLVAIKRAAEAVRALRTYDMSSSRRSNGGGTNGGVAAFRCLQDQRSHHPIRFRLNSLSGGLDPVEPRRVTSGGRHHGGLFDPTLYKALSFRHCLASFGQNDGISEEINLKLRRNTKARASVQRS